ncbi:enoyl-ACP reductase FabI [Fodinicurvata fenggangensis]|uniref:enoyl-ACP reductase FabI n=1 Tax=Fodinicurvata fenggangensis TaxID=1121830 RepID=UPI000B01EE38|nr:enoyl-ACP reductase FabI [Fodinicurvata fenggangensis]
MNMGLMSGKRGLVMGVANDHSIAWGIAREVANAGAELAFTYQGEAFGKRVKPLAQSLGSDILLPCDVDDSDGVANTFAELRKHWDSLDFVLHAVAYSDKDELKGRYLDTSRDNFAKTMAISCYSFTEVAREAQSMMTDGGALLTLTYLGATRVTPNYNVMGVAKAALEASVRYLATDLGPRNIRVNAISAGPMRTLAGSAIANARFTYGWSRDQAPLNRSVELDEVGGAGVYLMSDLAEGVTGEIHYVDCGYNLIGIPSPQRMTQSEVDKARTND